jgi:ribosome-binding protein aMBF1 (putative translation factor)
MMDVRIVGTALYGPEWQSPMATDLGVNVRTVQRWAAGETQPREWVWSQLARLVPLRLREAKRRVVDLEQLARSL